MKWIFKLLVIKGLIRSLIELSRDNRAGELINDTRHALLQLLGITFTDVINYRTTYEHNMKLIEDNEVLINQNQNMRFMVRDSEQELQNLKERIRVHTAKLQEIEKQYEDNKQGVKESYAGADIEESVKKQYRKKQ